MIHCYKGLSVLRHHHHLYCVSVLFLCIESMLLRVSIGKNDIAAILGLNNLELGVVRFYHMTEGKAKVCSKTCS